MVEAQGLDAEGQPGLHSFRVACLGTGLYGNSQLLPFVLSYTHRYNCDLQLSAPTQCPQLHTHRYNVTSPNQSIEGLDFYVKLQTLILNESPREKL